MLFFFPFICGFLVFRLKTKHFLLTLLRLELIVISIYLRLFFWIGYSFSFFSLVFISFSACEGALGLSILVIIRRGFGSDFISLFNFN